MITSSSKKSFPGLFSIAKYCFSEKAVTLDLPPYETHRFETQFPKKVNVTKEELIKYFKQLNSLRMMETACDGLYKKKEIRGFCHLYDGEEGIAVGIEAALTYDDCLITSYREHCQQVLRGDSAYQVLAELMGKQTGSTKGRGGSMHLYRKKNNFYGGHGIVGAQVPIGVGLAFALKYEKKPNVAVCMYGDGAANQGQIAEASNIAGLWKLPALFVCENNGYGMGMSAERASNDRNFYKRGDLIPGFKIDGHNVLHVREGIKVAKEYAVKNGPIFIEIQTYRYHGHSMSELVHTYRTKEEVDKMRKNKDCIDFVQHILLENKLSTEQELKDIQKEMQEEIDSAVAQASKDPYPNEEDILDDVYVNNSKYWVRGVEKTLSGFPAK